MIRQGVAQVVHRGVAEMGISRSEGGFYVFVHARWPSFPCPILYMYLILVLFMVKDSREVLGSHICDYYLPCSQVEQDYLCCTGRASQ